MKIKKWDEFKNKDENYDKPLTVLEVLPRGLFRVSYDPDFEENTFSITDDELESDFTKITK